MPFGQGPGIGGYDADSDTLAARSANSMDRAGGTDSGARPATASKALPLFLRLGGMAAPGGAPEGKSARLEAKALRGRELAALRSATASLKAPSGLPRSRVGPAAAPRARQAPIGGARVVVAKPDRSRQQIDDRYR